MSAIQSLGVIGLFRMIGKPLMYGLIAGSGVLSVMIAVLYHQVRKASPELIYNLSMGSAGDRSNRWLSSLRYYRHALPSWMRVLHTATLTVQYAVIALAGLMTLDALVLASTRM